MLEKRKAYLEVLAANCLKNATEATSKDTALRHLKSKHMYLQEIQTINGMLEKLETLENARQRTMITKDVLHVTSFATHDIKSNMVDPDKVEDLMDDMADTIAQSEEIAKVIGAPLTSNFTVEQEFEDLIREKQNTVVVPPPITTQMPTPPTTQPISQQSEEIRMLVPS
jgi:hypothetical protein